VSRAWPLRCAEGEAFPGSRRCAGRPLLPGDIPREKPEGINEVIHSDTDLALAIYRTQLFGPDDLDHVKQVQAGYQVQALSAFLNQPPPAAAPPIDSVNPLTPDQQKRSPAFFEIQNFAMRSAPTLTSEKDLRARFATIGIGGDSTFNADTLTPEMRTAIEGGMADAWEEFTTLKEGQDRYRAGVLG
jgi:hypothetical protein